MGSMVIGNTFSQETIRKIVQSLDVGQKNKPIFLLLTGPQNIGKTTFVQELVKEVLGMFYMQDFLFVQDMTSKIGKPHTLKVGTTGVEGNILTLDDETEHKDTTMREITTRLQHSSTGSKKVVLLENIERMTIGAANAFLKAAEEPLPGRIIIATTTHPAQIMETILSRAITVPFQSLTENDMESYIQDKGLAFTSPQIKSMFLSMAMGRPGVLTNLVSDTDEDVQKVFLDAMQALQSGRSTQSQYTSLTKLHKLGYLQVFVDAWIYKMSNENPEKTQGRLSFKKHIQTNVSIDRLLLNTIIS